MNLPLLAQRVFNTPVAIHPAKAEVIVAALAQKLGLTNLSVEGRAPRADAYPFGPENGLQDDDADHGYDMHGPVAIIPVTGTLVQKSSYLRPDSGLTGYNSIRTVFEAAMADDEVEAIVLDVDSPGGEVAGCFDLADWIYSQRGKKPIWAILTENAYSAAYALASSCDKLIVPRTGGTGSIGVICMHVDMSKWLAREGFAVTLVQYGARKSDGNEFQPISTEALRRAQADIDALGALFDATAARNRKIDKARVKSFQAGTFLGAKGVDAGLADAVMPPDAAMRALIQSL